jgi:hypothetical protein
VLLGNEQYARRRDGDNGQDDGDREETLALEERIGSGDQYRRSHDVQNERALANADSQRGNHEEKENGNEKGEVTLLFLRLSHVFSPYGLVTAANP